ncbi:MAG: hypothetical protein HUJ16_12205 [Kangiella sp.]|nr:hypothetical protein [Kangiella sp.]
MLFEEKSRTYSGPKTYGEGDFDFLDRSGRKEAGNVRGVLNYWLGQFPEEEQRELISRIQSRDPKAYESATFEIVLYAILTNLGASIEIHPYLDNGSDKHPDFLVSFSEEEEFYVEAVLASEHSDAELAAERRKNVVLDSIERLESPNFFLGINAEGNPETPPSGKALRRELSKWLATLDPDDVTNTVDEYGFEAVPKLQWCHEGWEIEFEAIPIKPEKRGNGQCVIGMLSGGARFVNEWEPIRDALRSKGNRYGELSKPFLIAVNVDAFSLDKIDEMQALYGQEEYVFSRESREAQPAMRRAANGLWNGPHGPQYTRISGAWLFGGISPWNIVSRKNTVYLNPWAQLAAPDELRRLNHASASEGKMEWTDGIPLAELLKLDSSWPE